MPICYAQHPLQHRVLARMAGVAAPDFRPPNDSPQSWQTAVYSEILEDKHCDDWEENNPYFSSEWHMENKRMRMFEEMRQAHALKMAEIDQSLKVEQKEIAVEHAKIAAALLELSQRNDRETGFFNKVFVALAVASVVLAVATIFFPEGVPGIGFRDDSPSPVVIVTPVLEPSVTPTGSP